ncbi:MULTISPECIES: hypothetical protein [Clostridium]|uniref:LiaF transmembrane domain-containing protein n=1 Tax=Clostridium cibarium TaxID=2762247 RepID=A0ABR8PVR6_9CLOT|nr:MULTISPECIES: hypothetical protein [Clostridium]MBD7912259.1 hypothetical protein [Clostridium cibarium]
MKKDRIFWGIGFILLGVFLVINRLGYFPDVNVFSLLFTVFLVLVIIKSLLRLNFPGVLFPLAFICIMYDNELGITGITPWTVLIAALFGSIGLSMIFNRHHKWIHTKYNSEDYKFEKIDVEDDSHVRCKSSFGDSIKYINSDNFEQADLECSFGALKVYFDNATMANGKAVVNINASFSGIELFVPRSWNIDDRTHVFLGGISEKNKNDRQTENTLTLVGDISFAGVEIIYI